MLNQRSGSLRNDDGLGALAMAVANWNDYFNSDFTNEEDKRVSDPKWLEPIPPRKAQVLYPR